MAAVVQLPHEQIGDQAVVADAAVVGGQAGVGEERGAGGVWRIPEAEQHERVVAQLVLPDGQRRDPDPAAHEQRPASVARRGEAEAERSNQRESVSILELAQPLRAGADVLDEELELVVVRGGAQDAEGARAGRAARRRLRPIAAPL